MLKRIFLFFSVFFILFPAHTEAIDEIVVSGDWRDTNLSEVDSSLILVNDEDIQKKQYKHFEDITYLIPNLNFAASDSRPRYFQIRGIGERSGYEGTPNSSVGFLIDDIDFSGQAGIASVYDIDQVEVYRGPQGSRMGASSLAGMIYIKTKDPKDLFEANGEITIGNYGRNDLSASINIPFTKGLKSRLSIRKEDFDGFRENLFLNRDDTSRKDEQSLRLKTNWLINDATSFDLVYFDNNFDDPADIWTIDGSLNTLSDRPGMDSQDTRALGVNLEFINRLNTLKVLYSKTDTDVVFSYDADWGNAQSHFPYVYDYFSETLRHRETSNIELRILSNKLDTNFSNQIQWIAGFSFYEIDESNDRKDDGAYGDPNDGFGTFYSESFFSSDYSSESKSLFGNLDYLISETLKLSFGFRWEDWDADYLDSNEELFTPDDSMNGGKISLINSLDNDLKYYLSIARGYKQGGFNLGTGLNSSSLIEAVSYSPEYLSNYEFGISKYFFSSKTFLDLVIFYSDRRDQQVLSSTQVDPQDPNTFLFLTKNAAEGRNYGAELSLNSEISDTISMFLYLGILETEISQYQSRPDLEGREQAHAPDYSFSAGLSWDISNNLELLLDLNGKSDFYYSDSHNNTSDDYILTNINMIYKKDKINLNFWIRNIFDEYYSLRGFYFGNEPPAFEDTLYERHGDPRNYGLTFRYEF